MSNNDAAKPSAGQNLHIRYDDTLARYATQVALNVSEEDVVLNFSSGLMPDTSNPGEAYLPIHTRIAMSHNNAKKLAALLAQALNQASQQRAQAAPAAAAAKLPSLDK
jgi:hypothetical protein